MAPPSDGMVTAALDASSRYRNSWQVYPRNRSVQVDITTRDRRLDKKPKKTQQLRNCRNNLREAMANLECQPACKPGSVRRADSCARDGHSSRPAVAGRLKQPTRATIRRRIQGFPCVAPIRFCSQWGLPCRSCCHARGALLPHHFTLTLRRFVFCGAFPRVTPAGSYPAPCLRGARTFLHCESGGRGAEPASET